MPGATLEARPTSYMDGFAVKRGMKGKTKPLHFWTSADVNKWLRKHGGLYFELYGDLLSKHEVTGKSTNTLERRFSFLWQRFLILFHLMFEAFADFQFGKK